MKGGNHSQRASALAVAAVACCCVLAPMGAYLLIRYGWALLGGLQ